MPMHVDLTTDNTKVFEISGKFNIKKERISKGFHNF